MAGKMIYAPLYIEDFKKGCEDLTNEQIGVYLRVLFEIYEEMGPIKFDDRKLAKRLNARPHKARALVLELISMGKLYLTSTGLISNHRAENEIVKFVSISVQNQLNGKSPKTQSQSKRQNPNTINGEIKRPLSGGSAILESRIKNNSSGDISDVAARGLGKGSSEALAGFAKRRSMYRRAS